MQTHEIIETIVLHVCKCYNIEDWRNVNPCSDAAMVIHKALEATIGCANNQVRYYFKNVRNQVNKDIFYHKLNTNEKFKKTYDDAIAIVNTHRSEKFKQSNFFCEGVFEFNTQPIPRAKHREILEYHRIKP